MRTVALPRSLPYFFAHETAHYYWYGFDAHDWIEEGAANFLAYVSGHARIGSPIEPYLYDSYPQPVCPDIEPLAQLETLTTVVGTVPYLCNYYLGERFFLDLYHTLGEDIFRRGFRNLYLKRSDPGDGCQNTEPDICHMLKAFKADVSEEISALVDDVVARLYGPVT